MRVVLDTNIFISGIFWSGASEKVLYALADDKFKLVISSEIIAELIKTLMNFKIALSFNEILLWLSIILWKSELVESNIKINIVKEDPDDNKFIEAALAGKAEFIVSQDNHLLKLKEHDGIKIVKPEEAISFL